MNPHAWHRSFFLPGSVLSGTHETLLLPFGLVLVIRARGWVRLFGAIQMAVVLSPIGLFIWWERWGSGYARKPGVGSFRD